MIDRKPKVAFLCVHNSCRSQIAEALGRHLAGDVFESFSGGTEAAPRIIEENVLKLTEKIRSGSIHFECR